MAGDARLKRSWAGLADLDFPPPAGSLQTVTATPQRRRRWLGLVALAGAVFTLVVAEVFLRGRAGPWLMLAAYGACLLFVAVAILAALLEVRFVAQRGLDERRALLNEALGEIQSQAIERKTAPTNRDGADKPPPAPPRQG